MVSREKQGQWQPGSGSRPSVEQARGYDQWVAEDPVERHPQQPREVYAQIGFRSGDPNVAGQQSLSGETWDQPGVAPPQFNRLPQWSDLPEERVTAAQSRETDKPRQARSTRSEIAAAEEQQTGVTLEGMSQRAGHLLDASKSRAGLGRDPEGQHFYSEERQRISQAARRQDVSPETMTSATAITSPKTRWASGEEPVRYPNLEAAEAVAEHSREGLPGTPEVESALPEMMGKARQIVESPGTRAADVVKEGPKVASFEQNLLSPHQPEGRATVDTHMVEALTGLHGTETKDPRSSFIGRRGRYEMSAEAIAQESQRRGLTPEEGQAAIWTEQKRRNESGATGREEGSMARTTAQATSGGRGQRHVLGQMDIFGGEAPRPDAREAAVAKRDLERRYTPRSRVSRPGVDEPL